MKIDISIREIDGEGYLCIKLADLTVLKRSKAFKPPTIEEVTEYCKSRGSKVDPRLWYDFYQAKGWMIGKNKMKDWQAACRTWEKETKGLLPESKGSNLGGKPIPKDYGQPSPTAVPMPEDLKKRILNIGK